MLRTLLILGRVSNLPTVWTNLLAGAVLGAAFAAEPVRFMAPDLATMLLLILAVSLHYTGGMFLNDAFDAEIDAAQRSNRPIPTGKISRSTVFLLGAGQLLAGVLLLFAVSAAAGWLGVALAGAILLYDWLHKRTTLAPVIMGACRFLVYLIAAAAVAGPAETPVLLAALGLWSYTAGLTYAAKQESLNQMGSLWPLLLLTLPLIIVAVLSQGAILPILILAVFATWAALAVRRFLRRAPGDVPRGVVSLIAGMALYDAALISIFSAELAAVALAGFLLTIAFQRVIPGT
ncbi:UbiA family prenyltransferase [Dichotomicrobium thermohalophilum]|uniref:4-hydroxybenzoate polyprenyltransferase n=1 Tax=Dichotomicrobium thermohalophilum TaxID=933063 RepID=A0A397PH17_9HYPH|nr:UbiA family prenyltransferase [Dichotomicrobium thermohalophilum]RIA45424.1 4-hydroxybenzoate polyprenyltransferase [Dichotomicrobium thermohalophilum]